MARIRLNQEYRNKIANRMRVHLEQENTQEKEKFFQLRESFLDKQNKTWELAKVCVERQYPKKDVDMAHYLQNKYPNVNTIAKDSCFHFGYMKKDDATDEDDKYESKHFDFRLNGDIDGVDRQDDIDSYSPQSRDFAYAYFRDELKAKEGCNPDINIEMEGEYCRDRQIPVSESEFNTFVIWQQAKGQLIMAHYKWIKSILAQCKFIKDVIKGYKFLDEAIEFATESGLKIDEAEIIRCNSSGLMIYNPKNAAQMLKSMKNKTQTRKDKIAARLLYEKQAQK